MGKAPSLELIDIPKLYRYVNKASLRDRFNLLDEVKARFRRDKTYKGRDVIAYIDFIQNDIKDQIKAQKDE